MTAVAIDNRDLIIDRVSRGDMLDSIANDLGIAAPNISKHLAQDPDYKEARELGVERRLDQAKTRLRLITAEGFDPETGKPVGITRALSNLARACVADLGAEQWFAEREFGHRWGQKSQVTLDIGPDLGDLLRESRERRDRRRERIVGNGATSAVHQAAEIAVVSEQQITRNE